MNEYLPEDIAILQVEQVDGRFHSRLNAKSKTYEYRIYKGSKPDVFERRYVWPMEEKLDVAKIREAAKYLTGTHDFMAFCGNRRMKKTTVRTIYQIEIEETEHPNALYGKRIFAKYGPYPDRNLSRSRTWRKDTGGYGADP